MTDTCTPQPAMPVSAPAIPWYKRPLPVITTLALAAGTLGAVIAIALSGPGTPANATAAVQADGYTLACTLTPAQVSTTFGSAAPYITSAALGTDSQGDGQIVVYVTPQGMASLDAGAALRSETVSGYFDQAMPGTTTAVSGDVLRVDFPASVIAAGGGLGCPA